MLIRGTLEFELSYCFENGLMTFNIPQDWVNFGCWREVNNAKYVVIGLVPWFTNWFDALRSIVS